MEQGIALAWFLASIAIGVWADSRKIGFVGGFFAAALLSPLIGAIIVASSKSKDEIRREFEAKKAQAAQMEALKKAAAPVDVAGQLAQLQKMREDGALTQEEFDAAKAKLLA